MAEAASSSEKRLMLNRREILNYAWLASLGVLLINVGGIGFLFSMPRFKEGEFGGVFVLGPASNVPPVDTPPVNNPKGKFWLTHSEDGILALYKVCTHLGCLYAWRDQEVRAFLTLVRARHTSLEMRDTLAFEQAEFRLRREPARSRVSIDIDGTRLDAWLMPHARVALSRSPLTYDTTDTPEAPQAESQQNYLVVPNGLGMRYLRPMEGTDRLVRALNSAAIDGGTVIAPAAGIESLIAANVLTVAVSSA